MSVGKDYNGKSSEYDIVVIGGGGSGLAAAVAATEKGASVAVLEKRRFPGGNSAMAGGLFAAESDFQKRSLIDARCDDFFRAAMDYSHWDVDPLIIRTFVDKSSNTISWLENMGVEFAFLPAMWPNQGIRTNHVPPDGGAEIIKALQAKCKEMGIGVICESPVKKLLIDERGKVEGILAETKEKEIRIMAKSIVIATGGYGGNKELLKQYHPGYNDNMITVGLPHTGDGLLMAMKIGAATEDLGLLQLSGPEFPGAITVRLAAQEPNTLWVNKNGERFTDEGNTFNLALRGIAVNRQPEKITYSLFDETIKNIIVDDGVVALPHVPKGSRAIMPGDRLDELPGQIQSEVEKGRVKISDSLGGIAAWMGADPNVLKATVNEYNSFCARGHDRIFVKDRRYLLPLSTPPYYAIKCHSSLTDTAGGIKVNHRMEVLDVQDKTISGLYAAGVCNAGWKPCYALPGSVLGFAINSGRIAGENAADYIL